MFRINLYGFGLLVLAGIIVNVVARPLLPGREPVWMALAGVTMIAVDLILRGRSRGNGNRWFSGEFGATIAFPAWILGICLIGYGAAKQMGLAV